MFTALADYMRLARAGAVMVRNDVIIPEDYRKRLPFAAKAAGAVLRILPGGGGGGRPGQRFARALEKLGPAWIKLGQFMATRPDVIGVEAATDLSRLKDALPPFLQLDRDPDRRHRRPGPGASPGPRQVRPARRAGRHLGHLHDRHHRRRPHHPRRLMSRVVVVGSYNQDFVWTTDQLPVPGATRLGTYGGGPGGKGFNQAVAAARAGAATTFVTALGADDTAAGARALAGAEGIDLREEVHADTATGTAGIFVDGHGRNVIVVAPGANAALTTNFVHAQADAFRAARVVLAQLEVAPDAVQSALGAASTAGALAILNPAPANAPTTDMMMALADVLTPNETEFTAMLARHEGLEVDPATLADRTDAELHALCRRLSPSATIVVTLGAAGAFVSHGERRFGDETASYRQRAYPASAVDTTGAGDAFNGALAAALAGSPQAPFREAVAFAARYAACSTERPGAALAMPRRADVTARFGG